MTLLKGIDCAPAASEATSTRADEGGPTDVPAGVPVSYPAAEACSARDEFLVLVAHELRNPLNAILGWARLLCGGVDEETCERGVAAIVRNAEAQERIISDLYDAASIAGGRLSVRPEPLELAAVAAEALESVRPSASAAGITLREGRAPEPLTLHGDAGRLRQVLLNLLANAVKFTPAGGAVDLWLERDGAYAQVSVSDSGCGIGPELLPLVFDRAKQGPAPRAAGGLGLGLTIARHLVELHGGTITAHSWGAGQGSTFVVRMPLAGGILELAGAAERGDGSVRARGDARGEAEIDETLADSFPASDPPAWTLGREQRVGPSDEPRRPGRQGRSTPGAPRQ